MLDRVTFTGADDSVNPGELVEISRDYPYVEWGILFSKSQQGGPRFPSQDWLDRFTDCMAKFGTGHRFSAHLCGKWVRELVNDASYSWRQDSPLMNLFQRVQLNFHGQFHTAHPDFIAQIAGYHDTQFIFQCDGVNDEQVKEWCVQGYGVPLFDTSGGAGVLPGDWPKRWAGIYCGYAGGLGPENIAEQLPKIHDAAFTQPYWIDMERRVRSANDRVFEIAKVRSVLESVEAFRRNE